MPELDDVINDAAPDAEFAAGDKLLGRSAATGGVASFDPDSVFDPLRAEIAAEYAPLPPFIARNVAGDWLMPMVGSGPTGTASFGARFERVHYFPFSIETDIAVDRIAIDVTTLGTGVIRLGLANMGSPVGSLIVDAGTVDVTSTGVKETATLSPAIDLAAGWYYCAMIWQGTSTTAPVVRSRAVPLPMATSRTASVVISSNVEFAPIQLAAAPGAIPATPTIDGSRSGLGNVGSGPSYPSFALRIAA